MITGISKVVLCLTAFMLGASPQNAQLKQTEAELVTCTDLAPLTFEISFYQAQTLKSLEQLGASNHPVGLYWLAQRDIRNADNEAAIEKLKRAAEQGLPDAYFRLAEIYSELNNHIDSASAQICGEALEAKI